MTGAARVARLRDSRKAAGLKEFRVWLSAEYADALQEKARRAGLTSPQTIQVLVCSALGLEAVRNGVELKR